MFRTLQLIQRVSRNLEAYKYMKAVSQQALLFKPKEVRELAPQEALNDRVVKAFFDRAKYQIRVFQSNSRLYSTSEFSSPTHSFYQVLLPFQKNEDLRHKFLRFYTNHLRVGRILQIMDYIAANVSYRYCLGTQQLGKQPEFLVVTASVDQINFYHPIVASQDCIFSGYATYAGTSSMEIQVDVKQQSQNGQGEQLSCSATFVMVAKSKNSKSKYLVPSMKLEKEQSLARIRNDLGGDRQIKRKEEAKKSLSSVAPSTEQSQIIHNIFLELTQNPNPQGQIQINQTKLQKTMLMHIQQRNLHGKIFGGFIMREAFELGWLCAYQFVKGVAFPEIIHIDDIQFISSVDVGSSLHFEAVVGYVDASVIHVIVRCECVKPNGERTKTNSLRLSFRGPADWKTIVFPREYGEAITYLQARRAISNIHV